MSRNKGLKTLLKLGVLGMAGLYAVNRYISSNSLLKNVLRTVNGKEFVWKQGNIFYTLEGEGEKPVLLIHDASEIGSGYEWNELIAQLKKDHLVYRVDLLGCGRSDKPAITYTNYLYVQMISDFIQEIIGEKTTVVTSGLSGSFAVMAAFAQPELFEKVIMINPVSLRKLQAVPEKRSKALHTFLSIPVIGTSVFYMATCRQNIEYTLEEKYINNPFKLTQHMIDSCYEAAHYGRGQGKHFFASLKGYYLNWDIRRALSEMKVPFTLLYGEDMEDEEAIAESYAALNKTMVLKEIAGAKKLPHIEEPEKVAACI